MKTILASYTGSNAVKFTGAGEDMKDMVNNPPHYTHGGIETIDYMEAKSTPEEFKGHCRLTAMKYLSRSGLKNDELEEAEKALWYNQRLVNTIKKQRGLL
jgi:hypothetical protein